MPDTPLTAPAVDASWLREAGYWLHLIRAVEEAGRRLYLQGHLPGSFYDGRGQEAIGVAAGMTMGKRDIACPLIRDMAVHLVRGVSPAEMLRHYLGRSGGPMEGRDGNIHLGAFDRGTVPMISHLPEMLPVALGIAISRRRRGEHAVAFGFCGDGASAGGVFHETLNLAALWNAPLVVIVERNRYAYMTPESRYLPVEHLSARAAGYGIEAMSVDGNDVVASYGVLSAAAEHARFGGGPVLVEAFTYRLHGHGVHDAQRYVPPDELEEWAKRDPLPRWEQHARKHTGWCDGDQAELAGRVEREVAAALEDALAAPYPDPAELAASVFA